MSWSVCTTPTSLSPPLSVAPPSVRPPTTTFLLSPTLTASPTYSQLRPLTPTLEGPRRPRLISDTLCLSPRRPPPSMAMMDPFKMDMSIWNNDFDQDVKALELWFMDLSEQEKLKSMEALIQHVTSDQARYFMGVLSQLLKRNEPVPTLPPPPTTSTSSSYPQYPQHPSRLTHATNTIMMGSGGAGGPHQTLTSQSFPSSPSSVSSQAFDLSQHGWTRPYVDHTNPHGPPLSSPLPQTQSNMGTITPVNTPTTFPGPPLLSRPPISESIWPFELILPKKTFRSHSPAPIGASRPQSPLNPATTSFNPHLSHASTFLPPSPSPTLATPNLSKVDHRWIKKGPPPPPPASPSFTRPPPRSWKDPVDFTLLNDIPAWLRSLRLHKYTNSFPSTMTWKEIIQLNDQELSDLGVAALGARNKFLKVFEQIKLALPTLSTNALTKSCSLGTVHTAEVNETKIETNAESKLVVKA